MRKKFGGRKLRQLIKRCTQEAILETEEFELFKDLTVALMPQVKDVIALAHYEHTITDLGGDPAAAFGRQLLGFIECAISHEADEAIATLEGDQQ